MRLLLTLVALAGCTAESDGPPDAVVADGGTPDAMSMRDTGPPVAPSVGDLLIEELYYAGAAPAGGTDHYFSDQFVELVNASDATLDLSGVYVGEVYGVAGEINPGLLPDSFRTEYPDEVVMSSVWRIPSGMLLEPGGHLVIAHDGTNHRPFSTIDLSGADFETYVAESGGDEDSPTVDNLELVHFRSGRDWLLTVFGPSVVIVDGSIELGVVEGPGGGFQSAPVTAVLDAIETLMDAGSGDFKRLPNVLDTGHAWVSGTYTGESLHRRRDGSGFVDTNDSGADFEWGAPEPGLPPDPDGVGDAPVVELGTGVMAFEPLEEGAVLELVAGLQGGWHLDVATRLNRLGPEGVLLSYEARSETAERVSFVTQTTLRTRSVIADGDAWQRVGDRVVLDITGPSDVVGTSVVVRVTASLGETTLSDERTVTIVDDAP
jgi:hypothetical protein